MSTTSVPIAIIRPKLATGLMWLVTSTPKPNAVVAIDQNTGLANCRIECPRASSGECVRCCSRKNNSTCIDVATPMIVINEFSIELTILSRRPLTTNSASVQTMLTSTTNTVSTTQRSHSSANMIATPIRGSQLTKFNSAMNASRGISFHWMTSSSSTNTKASRASDTKNNLRPSSST